MNRNTPYTFTAVVTVGGNEGAHEPGSQVGGDEMACDMGRCSEESGSLSSAHKKQTGLIKE